MVYVEWFPLARYARQAWSAPLESCREMKAQPPMGISINSVLEHWNYFISLSSFKSGKSTRNWNLADWRWEPTLLGALERSPGPSSMAMGQSPFLAWFYQPPEAPTRPVFEVLELCRALPPLRIRMWTAWVPSRPHCQAMHVSFPIFVPSLGESLNSPDSPWHFHDNISVPP